MHVATLSANDEHVAACPSSLPVVGLSPFPYIVQVHKLNVLPWTPFWVGHLCFLCLDTSGHQCFGPLPSSSPYPPPSSRPGSTIPERVTLTYSLLALQGPLGSDKAPSALTHQTAAYALKQQVTHRVVLFIGVVFVLRRIPEVARAVPKVEEYIRARVRRGGQGGDDCGHGGRRQSRLNPGG